MSAGGYEYMEGAVRSGEATADTVASLAR